MRSGEKSSSNAVVSECVHDLGCSFACPIIIFDLLKANTNTSQHSLVSIRVCASVNVFGQSAVPGHRRVQAYPLFELCSDRPQSLNPSKHCGCVIKPSNSLTAVPASHFSINPFAESPVCLWLCAKYMRFYRDPWLLWAMCLHASCVHHNQLKLTFMDGCSLDSCHLQKRTL